MTPPAGPVKVVPTPEDIARKAIARIKAQADPEKAVQAQMYFKEQISSYGWSADDLRDLAAEMHGLVKPGWTLKEAVDLCEILLPNAYMEAKSLATLILLRYSKDFGRPVFALIKKWLARDYCDNWASVDLLCPDGVGALLEKHPELVPKIKGWATHPNRWVKRAAAVSFIKLARRGKPPARGGRPDRKSQRLAPPRSRQDRHGPPRKIPSPEAVQDPAHHAPLRHRKVSGSAEAAASGEDKEMRCPRTN
jgi:3-methyladenine DNA glycosylase AlkD